MSNLGDACHFLGIEVHTSKTGNRLIQTAYIPMIVDMWNVKQSKTDLDPEKQTSAAKTSTEADFVALAEV